MGISANAMQTKEASSRNSPIPEVGDIPTGYRRTEAGVVPEDWEVKSIRDIALIQTGPFGTLLKAEEYSGTEGVPLISVGEIGGGFLNVTAQTPRVPEHVVRRLPQYVLRSGDIVFGRKGAVDRSALVADSEDGWFLGSDGMRIRPSSTCTCFPPYLAWQFQRHEVQEWLLQNATGTTMASLNQGILSRVRVPFAPLPEQRAIAEALSDVDGSLASLKALIAKKRAIKQAAMQQLLTGQTRLSGFRKRPGYKETAAGLIPEDWSVTRLGTLGTTLSGGTPLRSDTRFWGGDIPWVSSKDMKVTRIRDSIDHVTPLAIGNGTRIVQPGTILMVVRGMSLAHSFPVAIAERPVAFNQDLKAFVPDAAYGGGFILRWLEANEARILLLATEATHGTKRLPTGDLLESSIPLPPGDEQRAIAKALSDIDAEISALECRRDKAHAIKQGMMQQLLTGRVRLVQPGAARASENTA